MRAGDLDLSIVIQSNTPTQDEDGEEVDVWATITKGTCRATITKGRGRQRFIADHELNSKTVVFKIRHRTDFDTEDRIVYDSDNYDIKAIETIGRGEGLFVGATKVGA